MKDFTKETIEEYKKIVQKAKDNIKMYEQQIEGNKEVIIAYNYSIKKLEQLL